MKQIANRKYEKYQPYLTGHLHGSPLIPDRLQIICASVDL